MSEDKFIPGAARLDKMGREIVDPRPLEIPAGMKEPESLEAMVRRLVRDGVAVAAIAGSGEVETFEEAEDFDINDGTFDPSSPYEEVFDPVLGRGITHQEWVANEAVYRQRYETAYAKAVDEMAKTDALRAKVRRAVSPNDAPSPPPPGGGRTGGGGGSSGPVSSS